MKTVVLVDDCMEIRASMRRLLASMVGIVVVGEASHGGEAVELAFRQRPDVVLMDVSMPHMNGFEATKRIHGLAPAVCVIVVSAHESASFVDRAFEAGAVGYVVKRAAADDLNTAIEAVTSGRRFVSALCGDTVQGRIDDVGKRGQRQRSRASEDGGG